MTLARHFPTASATLHRVTAEAAEAAAQRLRPAAIREAVRETLDQTSTSRNASIGFGALGLAVGIGALWLSLRRGGNDLAETHEVAMSRWEDEGGLVLDEAVETLESVEEGAEAAVQDAAKRLEGFGESMRRRGVAALEKARAQALEASGTMPELAALVVEHGRSAAKKGLSDGRKVIRKHPYAATAAGFAAGGLLAALLFAPRRSR